MLLWKVFSIVAIGHLPREVSKKLFVKLKKKRVSKVIFFSKENQVLPKFGGKCKIRASLDHFFFSIWLILHLSTFENEARAQNLLRQIFHLFRVQGIWLLKEWVSS